jgi:hypothetical protein
MKIDIETKVQVSSDVRITVSNFDDGAWLHLQGRGFTSYTTLTIDQAIAIRDGLTAIIELANKGNEA